MTTTPLTRIVEYVHKLPVVTWPLALSPAGIAGLLALPDWPKGSYTGKNVNDPKLASKVSEIFELDVPELAKTNWSSVVTFGASSSPAPQHVDAAIGRAKYKVFAYLNEPDVAFAGTRFDGLVIPARTGTVVLFDIRLAHAGEQQSPDFVKRTIGLRMLSEPNL